MSRNRVIKKKFVPHKGYVTQDVYKKKVSRRVNDLFRKVTGYKPPRKLADGTMPSHKIGIAVTYENKRQGLVESAGKDVILLVRELVTHTNLSLSKIATRINETYGTELNHRHISTFLHNNSEAALEITNASKELSKLRADEYLEHNKVFVEDIKRLDKEISNLDGLDTLEIDPDQKAKTIAKLIDQKGKLLMRHGKLSGKYVDNKETISETTNTQVNLYQQVNVGKSDLINRLKKANFKLPDNIKNIVDAKIKVKSETDENKKTDNKDIP